MNPEIPPTISRRQVLATSLGCAGFSLTDFLQLQSIAKENRTETKGKAKSCIILFAWGGKSHLETWDPKPEGPKEIRGSFDTIPTATPGIHIGEHMPYLAKQTNKLAIVRSMHHGSSAHGKAMYWNFTGHKPPQSDTAENLPPSSSDWPSLLSVISKFKSAPPGLPSSIRIPYPLVDNGTLQAGEYGGWLGSSYNPIVIRTPKGKEFGGVSRDLGASRIDPKEAIDRKVLSSRLGLLGHLDQFQGIGNSVTDMDYFRNLATDMLMSPNVRNAFDLDLESQATKDKFGNHICV